MKTKTQISVQISLLIVIFSIFPPSIHSSDKQLVKKLNTADDLLKRIDSMTIKYNENQNIIIQKTNKQQAVQTYPDLYFEYRIENLNKKTIIPLVFNLDVRSKIDKYLNERTEMISKVAGLSKHYFPLIEQKLDQYNLPHELKYLAVYESGLDPRAVSKSGASGLWQFKLATAQLMGLKVDSYIDQRRNPYLSTDAACRYLKYLYDIFLDWHLTLAAYCGGPGEIRNAIIKSGNQIDYWAIRPFLSEQTRKYVPGYIATVYMMNHFEEHGIIAENPKISHYMIDTLWLDEAVSFSQISSKLAIDTDLLSYLNPEYKLNQIPDLEQPCLLVLPLSSTREFLQNENQIYTKKVKTDNYLDVSNKYGNTKGLKKTTYEVRKGDILHKIAIQFNCNAEDIKIWNQLPNNNLAIGQILVIYIK